MEKDSRNKLNIETTDYNELIRAANNITLNSGTPEPYTFKDEPGKKHALFDSVDYEKLVEIAININLNIPIEQETAKRTAIAAPKELKVAETQAKKELKKELPPAVAKPKDEKALGFLKMLTNKAEPKKEAQAKPEAGKPQARVEQKTVKEQAKQAEDRKKILTKTDLDEIAKAVDAMNDSELLSTVRDNDQKLYMDVGMGKIGSDEFRARAKKLATEVLSQKKLLGE